MPMKERYTKYIVRMMWSHYFVIVVDLTVESRTNSRRSADVYKIHQGSNVQKWISEKRRLPSL